MHLQKIYIYIFIYLYFKSKYDINKWDKVSFSHCPDSITKYDLHEMLEWLGKALTLSLIGYTSTHERAVHHSDWLYSVFSHVKIKRIDFYK